ncbi:hypothetical protein MKX03_009405 [Papaver bracteatum]|nr:hypothetical protein MKX03_009405 [Papaver bracteatum]
MKNLKLYSEITSQIQLQSKDEVLTLSAFDIERNRLFFASSENIVYICQIPSTQEWQKTSVAEIEHIELEPGDTITALDYLMEKEALVLGTSNGDLLLHIEEDHVTEVVGRVDGGVKTIAPSPDGALLAVITGFGQILVMTHDWDVLYETTLDDLPEDGDIDGELNGGSGQQFENPVSWRGDGKYFATLNGADSSSSLHKKLKIWERDSGVLEATSETKAFMGGALDWMPSGAKVATARDRKVENKCPLIVFYERNGLERNSFSIEDRIDGSVESLKWNCNSDLLATVFRCEAYDCVKVWFFSNNHWYLKQEMRYSKDDRVKIIWDPTKPFSLICWTTGGKVTAHNFVWVTSVMEDSTAFVIDNSKILVSPLALSLMPPPMCLFNLKFQSPVCSVAYFFKNSRNLLAACLSDGSFCVVELPSSDTWEELEGKEFSVEPSSSEAAFQSLRHLAWLDSNILLGVSYHGPARDHLAVSSGENGHFHPQGVNHSLTCSLQEIELVCSENRAPDMVSSSGWNAKVVNQISPEGSVIGIAPNPAKPGSAFVQLDGGAVIEYASKMGVSRGQLGQDQQKLDRNVGFSSSCPWMNVVPVLDSGVLKSLLFGLDSNCRLHISGKVLCNNCSSFSFYSNSTDQLITHLVLTTVQDLLFVINMDDVLHGDADVKYENFIRVVSKRKEENKNSINIWERGAKLVGALHGDEAALIIQTIRGNLECIYPRKLVLESIVNALVQRRFKDALLLVRRHRIDFNVIVDYCGWKAFLQSAKEFVQQVDNLSHITDFICSIKNENVMETLYKNSLSQPHPKGTNDTPVTEQSAFDAKDKVSSVLLAVRNALEEHVPESPARELCILTTLARSEPALLEEALKRIKVIREMELSGLDDPRRKSYPSAEEALKHLLWLSDAEAVYEAALGLYDLHLTAIVALNSQRDPKEFLPFLQELDRMQPAIMQYTIDLRLRRYENALKHIVSAGDAFYEDSMNIMKSNPQLFPLGLQLFTQSPKRSQVLEAWGDHLNDEKFFEDAAAIYLCCPSLEKALKAYRGCGNWKGVLTVAGRLNLGEIEVTKLATELCEELQELGKPAEAAKVALEYCNDVVSAVGYFVTAREWEEALRVGFMHRREDLISQVKSAADECADTLVVEYEEGLEKVGKYLIRYLAVRQRRLVLAAQLQLADKTIDDIDNDAASETSSNFSGMSAYTKGSTRKGSSASVSSNATSRKRDTRRQKHRGGTIRAGSPGEELALVDHIKSMALTTGAQHELKSLIVSLLTVGEEDTARKLQRAGDTFQISQMAAVKLAEDTISNDNMDEKTHTLENYIHKVRGELPISDTISWRSKVLLPP